MRKLIFVLPLVIGCAGVKPATAPSAGTLPLRGQAYDLVVQTTSCWMGGLWADAVGEEDDARAIGIERRCAEASKRSGVSLARYESFRAIEPDVVDTVAEATKRDAEHDAADAPHAAELVALLRAVANATRETLGARRAADRVKADAPAAQRATARAGALPALREFSSLHALFHVTGSYAPEARTFALLEAVDRMEIARGLPKAMKIDVLQEPFADAFGVVAPAVPSDPKDKLRAGVWLRYLEETATAAGHPVPAEARALEDRETFAWTGTIEGFADRLRGTDASIPPTSTLAQATTGVIAHLDHSYTTQTALFEARSASNPHPAKRL